MVRKGGKIRPERAGSPEGGIELGGSRADFTRCGANNS